MAHYYKKRKIEKPRDRITDRITDRIAARKSKSLKQDKCKNPNAPGKGIKKASDPIRKLKDIRLIMKMIEDRPRDHLLFVLGINNGLRVGDIIGLKVRDVAYTKPGESIRIVERKTGKENILKINKVVYNSITNYLEYANPQDGDFLFPSRKGGGHILVTAVTSMIKTWTKEINLKGRYGAHTLRKTWGYIQRVEYGTPFEVICKRYLHTNPAVTMRYIGVNDKEVEDVLDFEIG